MRRYINTTETPKYILFKAPDMRRAQWTEVDGETDGLLVVRQRIHFVEKEWVVEASNTWPPKHPLSRRWEERHRTAERLDAVGRYWSGAFRKGWKPFK